MDNVREMGTVPENSNSVNLNVLTEGRLLRNDPREFSSEELHCLAQLTLPDPEISEVKKTFQSRGAPILESAKSRYVEEAETRETSTQNAEGDIEDLENNKVGLSDKDESVGLPRKSSNIKMLPSRPLQFSDMNSAEKAILADYLLPLELHAPVTHEREHMTNTFQDSSVGVDSALLKSSSDTSSATSARHFMGLTLKTLSAGKRKGQPESVAEAILDVHHVDFIDQRLTSTLPVEPFLNATHVFLAHNSIEDLDGLQLLHELQVLVIHDNNIRSLEPLGVLPNLVYLDARNNRIGHLNINWDLPTTLKALDLRGNLCSPFTDSNSSTQEEKEDYQKKLLSRCVDLEELDGNQIGDESEENIMKNKNILDIPAATTQNSSPLNLTPPSSASSPCKVAPLDDVDGLSSCLSAGCSAEGLVATPPKNEEDERRSPQLSRGTHRHLLPGELRSSPTSLPTNTTDNAEDMKKENSSQDASLPHSKEPGKKPKKRQSLVDQVRGARKVTFEEPKVEKVEEILPSRCDEHLPYPTYNTALQLQSSTLSRANADPLTDAPLSVSVDALIQQYSRRTSALIDAVRLSAEPLGEEHPMSSRGSEGSTENVIEQTRHIRDRTRSDLEYASRALAHHSTRSVENIWADVEKVMQTRNLLISERQKQIQERVKKHSSAYVETLSLLQKGQHTSELEKYRKDPETFSSPLTVDAHSTLPIPNASAPQP